MTTCAIPKLVANLITSTLPRGNHTITHGLKRIRAIVIAEDKSFLVSTNHCFRVTHIKYHNSTVKHSREAEILCSQQWPAESTVPFLNVCKEHAASDRFVRGNNITFDLVQSLKSTGNDVCGGDDGRHIGTIYKKYVRSIPK